MDGVKIITIRRPQVMNATNGEMDEEILAVLKEGANDSKVKGFVITGYGGQTFSAGRDIGDFPKVLGDAKASAQYARDSSQLLYFIDQMDKPVVAAVNGMALGGGLEIALRCHSMVATRNASFQFPEITLGILPGIGGCIVPYRKWPASAEIFHEMLCLGRSVNAQGAADIGMVKKLTDNYLDMIRAAIEEVDRLQGKAERVPDG